uniref:G-protein coupled receptors family 1 profile domain-containing protein n=1 Tax=Nothobranchius furzeri TaxID=105023 RepID=A0A8C6NT74_NOTFU
VSDFLVGLLLMPLEIYKKITCWGKIMCVFYGYLIAHVVSASIGNIVLISVDRYVSICHPLYYLTRVTLARVKSCVGACWICAGVYRVCFLKDEFIQPGRSSSCVGECAFVMDVVAGTVDLILNFVAPVTVIVFLYMRVFAVAVSQARAMRSQITAVARHQAVNPETKKSELKAARTLGVLVVVYLLCFCPFYCYSLIDVHFTSKSPSSFFVFLFYFNSCLNPLIYALFYPWFRKSVKLIVTLEILQPGSCEANLL